WLSYPVWSGYEGELTRPVVRGPHRRLDDAVVGGQVAHRIGARRVPGEEEGLAAASPGVGLLPVPAAARIRHPVGAPEGLEERRLRPDPGQGVGPHAGAREGQGL